MTERTTPANDALGPLPADCVLDVVRGKMVCGYAAEHMRAERERCYALGVTEERAWFVQVLSEWDRTQDVEDVLKLRVERLSFGAVRMAAGQPADLEGEVKELRRLLRQLLNTKEGRERLGHLKRGIGTATPNVVWLDAAKHLGDA